MASGRSQNASQALREGLPLIEHREAEENARLRALRDVARIGIVDIDAQRLRSFEAATEFDQHPNAIADQAITAKPAPTGSR